MTLTKLDSITRSWALLTTAEAVRLVLGLVASLVIARVLGPAQFGVYSVLAAAVLVAGALAEGGLTEAAVLRMAESWPHAPEATHARASAFFCARLGLASLVIGVSCAVAAPISQQVLGLGAAADLLVWALLGVIATAASGAVSAMLQATGGFGRMSTLTLVNTGLTATFALLLALSQQLTLTTALIVLGIGTSVVTFALGCALLPGHWSLRPPGLRQLQQELQVLVATGRWLWIAGIFAMLAASLDVLVLNHLRSLELVGAYALALNLASKAQIVNYSLRTVLLPNTAQLRKRDDVVAFVKRGLARAAVIGAALLVLIPAAEPLILIIYGVEYAEAIGLFRLLLGVVIFDVLATPLLLLALAARQPPLLAGADGLRALTLGALAMALVPSYGALGAIGARLLARVAGVAVVLVALRRTD